MEPPCFECLKLPRCMDKTFKELNAECEGFELYIRKRRMVGFIKEFGDCGMFKVKDDKVIMSYVIRD